MSDEKKLEEKLKLCNRCKEAKPADQFHKDCKGSGGLRGMCKLCANEVSRQKRANNAEQISKQRKEFYKQNKERILKERQAYYEKNKDSIKDRVKNYYVENKDGVLEKGRRYHESHREQIASQRRDHRLENIVEEREKDKEYYWSHVEERRQYRQTQRGKFVHYRTTAKRKKREFSLTFEQFCSFWQKPCHYCGCVVETICLDRVDSSKGYTLDNIVPCCLNHNKMKMEHTPEEFLELCQQVVNFFGEKIK